MPRKKEPTQPAAPNPSQPPAPSLTAEALALWAKWERGLCDKITSADMDVIVYGEGAATRRQKVVNGRRMPYGPYVLRTLGAAVLKGHTLGEVFQALRQIEDAHQANHITLAELREEQAQFAARNRMPACWAPRAAEEPSRQMAFFHAFWLKTLSTCPGVDGLQLLATAAGLPWGTAAIATLRARLCIAHKKEVAWADALPIQEAVELLRTLLLPEMGRQTGAQRGRLSPREQEIVDLLHTKCRRMTTAEILKALGAAGKYPSFGTTKNALAALVRNGALTNRQDVRPPGYGLPEWGP
jgi:hypothetical protein